MEKKTIKINGKDYTFDLNWYDANNGILLACVLSLIALNNKKVNEVLQKCEVHIEDSDGKKLI